MQKKKLLDIVREQTRLWHYSMEKLCRLGITLHFFHRKKYPVEMGRL